GEGMRRGAGRRCDWVRGLARREPLGGADGAVVAMREKDMPRAKTLLGEARRLAPGDSRILALEATLAELTGDFPAAVEAARKAAAANSRDLASRWTAARVLSEKIPNGGPQAIEQVSSALKETPTNLFLLARLFDFERTAGDRRAAESAFDRLERSLEAETRADAKLERYLTETRAAFSSSDMAATGLKFRIVENLLRVSARYQQARRDIEPGVVGLPLEEWSPSLAAAARAV